jgi:hypothetical protein
LVDKLLPGGADICALSSGVGAGTNDWANAASGAIGSVGTVAAEGKGAGAGCLVLTGSAIASVVDVLAFFRETSTSADAAAAVDVADEEVSVAPVGRDPEFGADTDAELRCR